MIAFPIPTSEPVSPILVVLIAIAAAAGFVAIVFQAVRFLRNSGGRTDVFGPEVPREDRDDARDDAPEKKEPDA